MCERLLLLIPRTFCNYEDNDKNSSISGNVKEADTVRKIRITSDNISIIMFDRASRSSKRHFVDVPLDIEQQSHCFPILSPVRKYFAPPTIDFE